MAANANPTPLDMLYKWEKEKPSHNYLNQPIAGKTLTYTWQQFADEARRMAAALIALDLPPNSKIGTISKNCAHWLMADYAIMMSGHISVPLYPNVNSETISYVIEHSEMKALFVGKLDDWASIKKGIPSDMYCISFPTYYGDTGFENWDTLIAQHEPIQGTPNRAMDETFTIIYTSGTTGRPKGVEHTYNSLSFAINNSLSVIKVAEAGERGRFFSYLPLSHIAERMLVEMGSLYTNSEVYFAQSLDTFGADLSAAKPTVFLGVPRIWTKFQMKLIEGMSPMVKILMGLPIIGGVIKKKIREKLGLNEAQHCLTGAAPTPPALMKWFLKLGITIQEVYGMTENCAYSHYTRKNKIKYGSTGQAMPKVDVKISEIGEILVKSEANMKGYYKQPDLTADAFDGEYLRTGDKGVVDKDGFLKITGRVKDIFKTEKGKYVSPNPIELKLAVNSDIEQVCVVGTNLPQPIALVVLSEEARSKDKSEVNEGFEKLLKEVNPKLEKHEKLKKVVLMKDEWTVENSMLTPTLKIKRNAIEEKHQDSYTKWYSEKTVVVRC